MDTTSIEYYLSVEIFYWLIPLFIFGALFVYTKNQIFLMLYIFSYIAAWPASIRKREIIDNATEIQSLHSGKFNIKQYQGEQIFNPSVILYNNKYHFTLRYGTGLNGCRCKVIEFVLDSLEELQSSPEVKRNILDIQSHDKVYKNIRYRGIEDTRLFEWNENIYGLSARVDYYNNKQIIQPCLVKFNKESYESWHINHPDYNQTNQKNWSPFVIENRLFCLVYLNPLTVVEIVEEDGKIFVKNVKAEHEEHNEQPKLSGWRTSTPMKLKHGKYHLFLHKKIANGGINLLNWNHYYHHKFAQFEFELKEEKERTKLVLKNSKISKAFNLHGDYVPHLYFLTGFEFIPETENLFITYGKNDKYPHWMILNQNEFVYTPSKEKSS